MARGPSRFHGKGSPVAKGRPKAGRIGATAGGRRSWVKFPAASWGFKVIESAQADSLQSAACRFAFHASNPTESPHPLCHQTRAAADRKRWHQRGSTAPRNGGNRARPRYPCDHRPAPAPLPVRSSRAQSGRESSRRRSHSQAAQGPRSQPNHPPAPFTTTWRSARRHQSASRQVICGRAVRR